MSNAKFLVEDIEYDCPIEALSNILGRKWIGSIIWFIKEDKKRLGEIQRHLENCSKKMLLQQLYLFMENNIIVNEKEFINNTVESYYYLSEDGKNLLPLIEQMILWGETNLSCSE